MTVPATTHVMRHFEPQVIAALSHAAKSVTLEPALLLALCSVETNGEPFAEDNSPTILCERATFYKELPTNLRAGALKSGLAAAKWSHDGYADQGSFKGRQALLARMADLDEDAAYRSISVGLGQIMGFNCSHAGYQSARAMYDAFSDLGAQARAIVAVLPALGVLDALKRKDWVTVAVRYNGPGERVNHYDAKLASAYAHWKLALATGQLAPPEGALGLWSHGPAVESLQRHLNAAGVPVVVDGTYGPKTAAAVATFQLHKGMASTQGVADQDTLNAIANGDADPVPQGGREVATEEDLAQRSGTVRAGRKLNVGGLVTGGLGILTLTGGMLQAVSDAHHRVNTALDQVDAAKATAARLHDMAADHTTVSTLAFLAAHPMPFVGAAMVGLGGLTAYLSRDVIARRLAAHRTGAAT